MKLKGTARSTIVPGRKMITNQVAYHQAGIRENISYLAEKTIAETSSILNDTQDNEERDWRKQGLTEKQIYLRLEDRRLKKIRNAENRLKKEMYGAKDFQELLEKHEYSERESDGEDVTVTEDSQRKIEVFAVPSLPKHLEKSMFGSPAVGVRGSGKAGLSCSTPKSANDVSMGSLRSLDISHVVAIDQLDAHRVTVQSKNVLIPIVENGENSSLEKTFTDQKSQKSVEVSFHQNTPVIQNDMEICEMSSLQKTYIIEENKDAELSSNRKEGSLLQKAFDKDDTDGSKRNSSLQNTFTVVDNWKNTLLDSISEELENGHPKNTTDRAYPSSSSAGTKDATINDVVQPTDTSRIANDTLQGGEKSRSSKKVGLQEREKRANVSIMSSMIEDIPSPGAGFFKNTRKKLRPTNTTPQRTKNNRMSTESDKEKTIEMLSMAEEASVDLESIGPSFVDPISVNGSRVSPPRESEEPMDVTNAVTPKSTRRNNDNGMKAIRVQGTETSEAAESLKVRTPKYHYQTPTFSSLVKNKNANERNDLLESTKRDRRHAPVRSVASVETEKDREKTQLAAQEEEEDLGTQKINDTRHASPAKVVDTSNNSTRDINYELDVLSIRDQPELEDINEIPADREYENDNFDGFNDERRQTYAEEEDECSPSRVALMSDSIASVDFIDRRSTRRNMGNDTVVEDGWQPDEGSRRGNRGRNGSSSGLQLKKREIIQPATPTDEVRRSKRTRVKPVRSWLGEKPVYVNSPSGGKRLTGVTDVIIKDRRLCKYRTADLKLATEREQKEKALRKNLAAERRRQLAADHKRGRRLNESQEDIHTDDEDE